MGTWALGHSKSTWALKALKALGHPRHLDTWALRHLGTWALERYLGTRALKALEALYLADS